MNMPGWPQPEIIDRAGFMIKLNLTKECVWRWMDRVRNPKAMAGRRSAGASAVSQRYL